MVEKSKLTDDKTQRKGFSSFVILGTWTLWNQRNKCVFDSACAWPALLNVQHFFKEEMSLWCLAGAQKLQELGLGRVEGLA